MPLACHRAVRLTSATAFDAFLAPTAERVVVHFMLLDLQLRWPARIWDSPLGSRVFSFTIRDFMSQATGVALAHIP